MSEARIRVRIQGRIRARIRAIFPYRKRSQQEEVQFKQFSVALFWFFLYSGRPLTARNTISWLEVQVSSTQLVLVGLMQWIVIYPLNATFEHATFEQPRPAVQTYLHQLELLEFASIALEANGHSTRSKTLRPVFWSGSIMLTLKCLFELLPYQMIFHRPNVFFKKLFHWAQFLPCRTASLPYQS